MKENDHNKYGNNSYFNASYVRGWVETMGSTFAPAQTSTVHVYRQTVPSTSNSVGMPPARSPLGMQACIYRQNLLSPSTWWIRTRSHYPYKHQHRRINAKEKKLVSTHWSACMRCVTGALLHALQHKPLPYPIVWAVACQKGVVCLQNMLHRV